MNRNQFLQLAIIAPIAGFFGIKALKKGSINVFLKCQAKAGNDDPEWESISHIEVIPGPSFHRSKI